MLRFTTRVLILGLSGAVLATVGALSAIGQNLKGVSGVIPGQVVYPNANGQCDPGWHNVTRHELDASGDATVGPFGMGWTQAGDETPICLPNDPGSRVSVGPMANQTPTPSPTPSGSGQPGDTAQAMLAVAQAELNSARTEADAALAALEKCEQNESADAANYPDGVEHSPGYTGRGAGFDRHASVIDKNPCKALQQTWDAAYARYLAALQNWQRLESLVNSRSNDADSTAPPFKQFKQ